MHIHMRIHMCMHMHMVISHLLSDRHLTGTYVLRIH